MKLTKILALLFGLMGLGLSVFAVWLGLTCRDLEPVLLSPSVDATKTVEALFQEACDGDYAAASARILGNPKIGMSYSSENIAETMIWDKFRHSFSYELVGECFATDAGLAQKVKISYLHLDSITAGLKERIQQLLEEMIANAEKVESLYEEKHELKESYVKEALQQAVEESIARNVETETMELTVNLIWQDDRWWVLSDDALLSALSGGIVK